MYLKLFEFYKIESKELSKKVFENKKYNGSSQEAYDFMVPFLKLFYNKDFNYSELSGIITDSDFDGGIDAFHFDDKKYIDIFEFKSKEGSGPSDKDLDKLITSIEKYLKRGEDDFTGDESSKKNFQKLKKIKDREIRIFIVRKKMPYSMTDLFNNNKTASEKIRKLIKRLEKIGLRVFFEDIDSLFLKNIDKDTIIGKIVLDIQKDLLAKNQQGSKELVAKISVKVLLKEFIGKYGIKIISSNIRGHLNKKRFSDKMIETLKADPEKFWVYHNGITITCSDIIPVSPLPHTITIENPQIVNGAQTLFGLYHAYEKGLIDDSIINKAAIICKIIRADGKLTRKICETSNTQNAVKSEDLVSNEEINIFLEKFIYKASSGRFIYKRKKGGKSNHTITSTEFFQWACSAFLQKPAKAKNEKQFLFDFVTQKGQFENIERNIKKNMDKVIFLCEVAFFVKEKIKKERKKEEVSLLRHMDMHIIAGLYLKNNLSDGEFNKIFTYLKKYYIKEIKDDPTKNANKIFTKDEKTWESLKKILIKSNK